MAEILIPTVGTAAQFTSNNPTLNSGETGFESDTGRTKIGDGSTAWTSLPYQGVNEIAYASRSTTPLVASTTNTAGAWSSAVTAPAAVPTGAIAMLCVIDGETGSTTGIVCVEKASGITLDTITTSNAYRKYVCVRVNGNVIFNIPVWIPLDSSKQFKWAAYDTNMPLNILSPIAYRWGV